MRTNAYSSDFGLNPNRIDIKLNSENGAKTVAEIIALINSGETVINTTLSNYPETYENALCTALNAIGITDIRGGGDYTLYKPNKKYSLSGERDHDQFITSEDMGSILFDILMGCHHQGACDSDVNEAREYFEIKDYSAARQYILDCGIDEENIQDDNSVFDYYIWMLAGDIQDMEETEAQDA
jgi:hypothetical protein